MPIGKKGQDGGGTVMIFTVCIKSATLSSNADIRVGLPGNMGEVVTMGVFFGLPTLLVNGSLRIKEF